jgi:hypothetical protein
MLNAVKPSVIMSSVVLLNIVMLTVITLSATMQYVERHCDEWCHHPEYRYAECHFPKCRGTIQ